MAIPKVFGIETEYGIAAVGAPDFNPVLSSSLLISTYAGSLRRIRWDYEQESPLPRRPRLRAACRRARAATRTSGSPT